MAVRYNSGFENDGRVIERFNCGKVLSKRVERMCARMEFIPRCSLLQEAFTVRTEGWDMEGSGNHRGQARTGSHLHLPRSIQKQDPEVAWQDQVEVRNEEEQSGRLEVH